MVDMLVPGAQPLTVAATSVCTTRILINFQLFEDAQYELVMVI